MASLQEQQQERGQVDGYQADEDVGGSTDCGDANTASTCSTETAVATSTTKRDDRQIDNNKSTLHTKETHFYSRLPHRRRKRRRTLTKTTDETKPSSHFSRTINNNNNKTLLHPQQHSRHDTSLLDLSNLLFTYWDALSRVSRPGDFGTNHTAMTRHDATLQEECIQHSILPPNKQLLLQSSSTSTIRMKSSNPHTMEHALSISKYAKLVLQAHAPFSMVHANAAYHARWKPNLRGNDVDVSKTSMTSLAQVIANYFRHVASCNTPTTHQNDTTSTTTTTSSVMLTVFPVWGAETQRGIPVVTHYLVTEEEEAVSNDDDDDDTIHNDCFTLSATQAVG